MFELAQYGLPSILIPYPHASGNHQAANARWMEQAGAATVLPDAELTPDELVFFDRLAQLTAAPDEHAKELRALYEQDARLRPGSTVWNDVKQATEQVDEAPAGLKLD